MGASILAAKSLPQLPTGAAMVLRHCWLGGFVDTCSSTSCTTRALTPFWNCKWDRSHPPGTRSHQLAAFAVRVVSVSQSHRHGLCLPFRWHSWGFRLGTCRDLEKLQPISCLPSLMLHSLWIPSCSSLSWQDGSSPAPMFCRRGALAQPWREAPGNPAAPSHRAAFALGSSL